MLKIIINLPHLIKTVVIWLLSSHVENRDFIRCQAGVPYGAKI